MMRAMWKSVSYRAGHVGRPLVVFSSLRGYRRSWVAGDMLDCCHAAGDRRARATGDVPARRHAPHHWLLCVRRGHCAVRVARVNPQMSLGADSTIAPLFAVGIAHLSPIGSPRYVDLVGIMAVAVGVFVALVWLLRLGWIAEFLSAPIITGFLAGVAVVIVVDQIPDPFGLAAASSGTVHRIAVTASHLDRTNGWALGIARART
jgi:sulfate permease, SulP family